MLRAALLVTIVALPAVTQAQDTSTQLVVATTPSGAQVTVDGQALGAAPLTARGLLPGSHIIEARWADGQTASTMATVASGMSKVVALSPGMKPAAAPSPTAAPSPAAAPSPTAAPSAAAAPSPTAAPPPTAAASSTAPSVNGAATPSPATTATPPPSAASIQAQRHVRRGMALTFAGAGVLVLGAILTGVAYVQPSPYSFQDLSDYQTRHDALLGVGISFMICGAGLTTIGAIDWMRASQPR